MCGCRNPTQLVKKPLVQFFAHPDSPGDDILAQWVRGGCRILLNAISRDTDHQGSHFYFNNAIRGVFSNGRVAGLWGMREVVTEREWRLREQKKLVARLTDSQRSILEMTVHGKSLKEIGAALSLSINTVESYRLRALRKLELRSVPELIRYSAFLGLDDDIRTKETDAIEFPASLLALRRKSFGGSHS